MNGRDPLRCCMNHSWCECECCIEHEERARRRDREHDREVDALNEEIATLKGVVANMQVRLAVRDAARERLWRDWLRRGTAIARGRGPVEIDTPDGRFRRDPWPAPNDPETAGRAADVARLREVVRAGGQDAYRRERDKVRGVRLRDEEAECAS